MTAATPHPVSSRYRDPEFTVLFRTDATVELQLAHRSVRAFAARPKRVTDVSYRGTTPRPEFLPRYH